MQRLDCFWSAQKSSFRIATAIVKIDHVIKRRGLAIAEIRSSLGHLPKSLGAPQAYRNCLLAEIAVARSGGIVTEMAIHVEVAVCHRGIADQRLIGRAAFFCWVSVR